MIELKVTVDAPELSAAINHLADAIESKPIEATVPAKNSRKKATAKTAQDVSAVSANAPSEADASAINPAPVADAVAPQPVAVAQPVATPAPSPIPQPAAQPMPAPVPEEPVQQPAQPATQKPITVTDIINAAMPLMNSNPTFAMSLQQTLAKYSVQAVNQLKPEQLPSLAADLRALGAKI